MSAGLAAWVRRSTESRRRPGDERVTALVVGYSGLQRSPGVGREMNKTSVPGDRFNGVPA